MVFFFKIVIVIYTPLLLQEGGLHVLEVLFGLVQLPLSTAEPLTIDVHFSLCYFELGEVCVCVCVCMCACVCKRERGGRRVKI